MRDKGLDNAISRRGRTEVPSNKVVHILLVEDHADTANAISMLLNKAGHIVKIAHDTTAALNAAQENLIDLVICDLGLPDGDGYELMRELKERYALPGICLSGFNSDDDIQLSKDAGFAAHIGKPPDMTKLQALITQIVC